MKNKAIISALAVHAADFDFTATRRAERYGKRGKLVLVKDGNGSLAIVQGYAVGRTIGQCEATSLNVRHLLPDSHAARCYLSP